jgi:large subunit ribosomal protein L25
VPDIVLTADTTRPTGSANSRRLRHTGRVPAVVYGHGVQSTAISVDARALRSALSTAAGQNAVFELDVDGTHHLAMAKVVDHHPVRHTIAHVDFIVINRNEKVTADVPLTVEGEAEAVRVDGGVVDQVLYTLSVTMLPNQIPDAIAVDISDLAPGGAIRVSDLTLPAGVTTEIDPETAVVMAALSAVLEEEPVAAEEGAEAGEGQAAQEGEPAEGA